jgi:hypothetical protein
MVYLTTFTVALTVYRRMIGCFMKGTVKNMEESGRGLISGNIPVFGSRN